MRDLRPPVIAGLTLVVLGGLWLLRNLGLIPRLPIAPLVLIAVGAIIVIAALRSQPADAGAGVTETPVAVPLDGAARARILLDHGAGTLDVTGGGQPGLALDGSAQGAAPPILRREGDLLEIRLRPLAGGEPGGWMSRGEALSWRLALSGEVPLEIELRTGASRLRADLSALGVERVRLRTGASDVDLVLPGRGRCSAFLSAGAAEIRVRVPEGVAASVRNRTALASFRIDELRFPRTGDVFRSPDYEHAEARADIDVEGGLASFDVR